MGALYGERVTLGQERGPDVDLVVYGDDAYARYETPAGYPVIYDDRQGLFTYALLQDGTFVSSGVPATATPPRGAVPHAEEAPAVRQAKMAAKLARRSPPPDEGTGGADVGPTGRYLPGGQAGPGGGGAPPGGTAGQGGPSSSGGTRPPESRTGPGDTRSPGRSRGPDGSGVGG